MIGKIKSRSLDMEAIWNMTLIIFFTKNNEESKKKNTMNERVYFTLYELSRRKKQGTSFLVKLNCNNGRTRERGK